MDVIIDATMGCREGEFTFCPIEWVTPDEFQVVLGLSYLGSPPTGSRLLGIWHPDGPAAMDAFVDRFRVPLEALQPPPKGT